MNNLDSMWKNAIRTILLRGRYIPSRDGDTKEIIGYQGVLYHPIVNVVYNPVRKFSLPYACAEVLWYLSMTGVTRMIEAYAPQYSRFTEDGIAYGAYGARWRYCAEHNQLRTVIDLLRKDPDSRQAIMSMWRPDDLAWAFKGGKKDLPCTLALQFLVRSGNLYCIATMRSNDVWLGMPYDVFAFTTIQRIIADELGLGLGTYIHQAGSEHLYARNKNKAEEAAKESYGDDLFIGDARPVILADPGLDLYREIAIALKAEEDFRGGKSDVQIPKYSLLADLVLGAAMKWKNIPPAEFVNPVLGELADGKE